jgi:hypothetical protein
MGSFLVVFFFFKWACIATESAIKSAQRQLSARQILEIAGPF